MKHIYVYMVGQKPDCFSKFVTSHRTYINLFSCSYGVRLACCMPPHLKILCAISILCQHIRESQTFKNSPVFWPNLYKFWM